MLPSFLPSTAATHYSILCIAIDKEGCYLEVTLVLPSTAAMYHAALGNLQVTPLVIYSNVQCPYSALHSTAALLHLKLTPFHLLFKVTSR